MCREGEREEGTAAQTTLALRSVREEPPEGPEKEQSLKGRKPAG